MKRLLIVVILLSLSCAGPNSTTTSTEAESYPQNPYLELLRSDVRAGKVAVITDAMALTGEQSGKFWPVYREYEVELSKIWDGRLALIETYGKQWGQMTDAEAKALAERFFELEERQVRLNRGYYSKFHDAVGGVTAAKFFQIEHRIDLLIDLQIMSQLPLIVSGS